MVNRLLKDWCSWSLTQLSAHICCCWAHVRLHFPESLAVRWGQVRLRPQQWAINGSPGAPSTLHSRSLEPSSPASNKAGPEGRLETHRWDSCLLKTSLKLSSGFKLSAGDSETSVHRARLFWHAFDTRVRFFHMFSLICGH
jgi:hypothetical protein